jgi:hypothetical protein
MVEAVDATASTSRDPEASAAQIQLLFEGAGAMTVLHGTDISCHLAGAAARRLVESALLPARGADTGPAYLVP